MSSYGKSIQIEDMHIGDLPHFLQGKRKKQNKTPVTNQVRGYLNGFKT